MKILKLKGGSEAVVDDRDYVFLSQFTWYFDGKYARRVEAGKTKMMHREILDTPLGFDTDHINGNKLDNRRENLRIATRKQNLANKLKFGGSSKYKGVSLFKRTGKWTAQICPDGEKIHLGYFSSEEEAARAYDKKAMELFGIFARTNFIEYAIK